MKAQKLSFKKALELLNSGSSLTAQGKNLDTLRKRKDGTFSWCGRSDRQATILEEKDIVSLFGSQKWAIDLI